jgi:hypothetical protein
VSINWPPFRLSKTDALAVVEQVMIEQATELNRKGYPALLLALQIHLRHLTDTALERRDEMAARFCNELGYYLRMIGDLAGARPYLEQALAHSAILLGSLDETGNNNVFGIACVVAVTLQLSDRRIAVRRRC